MTMVQCTYSKEREDLKIKSKYYIHMTVRNESGGYTTQGKLNKLIVMCDTRDQAVQIYHEAWRILEPASISLCHGWPHFNPGYYDVTEVHYDDFVVDWALDRCDSMGGFKDE